MLGFILAAPAVAYLAQSGWNRHLTALPMLAGSIVIYVPALIWLTVFDFDWPPDGGLLSEAVFPFVPGDLLKLTMATLVVGIGWRYADMRSRRSGTSGRA
jgi:biotin transport system substrate-specific component